MHLAADCSDAFDPSRQPSDLISQNGRSPSLAAVQGFACDGAVKGQTKTTPRHGKYIVATRTFTTAPK